MTSLPDQTTDNVSPISRGDVGVSTRLRSWTKKQGGLEQSGAEDRTSGTPGTDLYGGDPASHEGNPGIIGQGRPSDALEEGADDAVTDVIGTNKVSKIQQNRCANTTQNRADTVRAGQASNGEIARGSSATRWALHPTHTF